MIPGTNLRLLAPASGGYVIEGSATLDLNEFLHFTPSSAGNRRTYTIHMIVKTNSANWGGFNAANGGNISGGDGLGADVFGGFGSGITKGNYSSGWSYIAESTAKQRDFSAWYDYTLVYDVTQSTSTNRVKVYINGTQVALDQGSPSFPAQNSDYSIGNTVEHNIGMWVNRTGFGGGFQLARFAWVDGAALTPAAFGETNDDGFWEINEVNVDTWGTNGVLLEGGSNIAAGTDTSGEGNNWGRSATLTATNDSPTDNSTNYYGDYATWDPLVLTDGALSNGNLTTTTTSAVQLLLGSTLATPLSGTFWVEGTIDDRGNHVNNPASGWRDNTNPADYPYNSSGWYGTKFAYIQGDGDLVTPSGTSSTFVPAFVDGDMWGWAVDIDNKAMYFAYKPASGSWTWANSATVQEIEAGNTTNATYTWTGDNTFLHSMAAYSSSGTCAVTTNFGATAWNDDTFQPTGFVGLATQNLPEPAIANPDDHFHSQVVTHDGSSTAATCTFNLDTYEWLAIIKNTTGAVENWYMIDSLRGVTKVVTMNTNAAETTDANMLTVSGTTFTLGSTLSNRNYLVEFHRAGLAADTASNEEGSLNTTATSVNLTSGFAISTYTGTGSNTNYGHGLNSAPEWTITKLRVGSTQGNYAWHVGLGAGTKVIYPHLTNAIDTAATVWNSTVPSATLNSLGTSVGVNTNTYTYVNWSWHSVDGFSKFGSYEGNGNADGAFVNTGFAQESMFVKNIDAVENWVAKLQVLDNTNENISRIFFEQTAAADTSTSSANMDMVSNGFKNRGTNAQSNSAATFIYGAWGGRAMTDGAINQGRAK